MNRILCGLSLFVLAGTAAAQVQIDINRPRNEFDCAYPNGIAWYGSQERCLQELCLGKNVTNQWLFDGDGNSKRRRRNPCYRVDPRSFND